MGKIFYYRREKRGIILDRTMMRWCDRLEPITFYISHDVPRGRLWTRLLHIDIVVGPGEHVENEILDSASLDLSRAHFMLNLWHLLHGKSSR